MRNLFEQLATLPKILTLAGVSVASAASDLVQTAQNAPAPAHWAQVLVWITTGIAALLAAALSGIRIYEKLFCKTLSEPNKVKSLD